MQMYIYIYIYIYIRLLTTGGNSLGLYQLLTTGGDTLGLYQTTHDWWRYLRAVLVVIVTKIILIIYLWELRAFTPENYLRLQASPLTSRLVKLEAPKYNSVPQSDGPGSRA